MDRKDLLSQTLGRTTGCLCGSSFVVVRIDLSNYKISDPWRPAARGMCYCGVGPPQSVGGAETINQSQSAPPQAPAGPLCAVATVTFWLCIAVLLKLFDRESSATSLGFVAIHYIRSSLTSLFDLFSGAHMPKTATREPNNQNTLGNDSLRQQVWFQLIFVLLCCPVTTRCPKNLRLRNKEDRVTCWASCKGAMVEAVRQMDVAAHKDWRQKTHCLWEWERTMRCAWSARQVQQWWASRPCLFLACVVALTDDQAMTQDALPRLTAIRHAWWCCHLCKNVFLA